MVEVVAHPGEADPKGEDDHAELEEGSQHLDGPHKPPQTRVLQTGEVVQTGLKQVIRMLLAKQVQLLQMQAGAPVHPEVDDQEHAAVEAEAGVPGQEGEPRLGQLLLGVRPGPEVLADLLLLRHHEPLVAELVPAELVREARPAHGEVVRPQPPDGVLGQLGEEERGERAQREVAETSVQLHQDPRGPVVAGTDVSHTSWLLYVVPT